MAILELDKIIFTKTVIGIVCTKCGGDLKPTGKNNLPDKIITIVSLGKVKIRHYQCDNCKKKYIIL
jgi:uncharacterized protein with PIN domain